MSAEAETKLKLPPLLSLKYAQTLSHSYRVRSLDIRVCAIKDMNMNSTTTASAAAAAAAILIVGLCNGEVIIYNALLSTSTTTTSSTTQCIQFTLLKCLRAHNDVTTSLHFHRSRLLFASASLDADVKVWSLNNMKRPRLIKRLWHVSPVCCVRYSQSGNLLTGCLHGWLRVFEPEPLFSLRWKFHGAQPVRSVAWSPSNGIAASFGFKHLRDIGFIQVWDSSFRTLFKHQRKVFLSNHGLVFANHLLLSSGGSSKTLFWYHMRTSKAMKLLTEKDTLPFCEDVVKIIGAYLPGVTDITCDPYPLYVGAVGAFSSHIVVSYVDHMLRVYDLHEDEPRLLTNLHCPKRVCYLATCVYPGPKIGYVIASGRPKHKDVDVAVTFL